MFEGPPLQKTIRELTAEKHLRASLTGRRSCGYFGEVESRRVRAATTVEYRARSNEACEKGEGFSEKKEGYVRSAIF